MEVNLNPSASINPLRAGPATHAEQVERARELQQAYREFVGKSFFGQLLKSMRSTVGKAAYFDGGRAEEVFRSQLDQTLADHMTEASASSLADPSFAQQFPAEARLLENAGSSMESLQQLRRF